LPGVSGTTARSVVRRRETGELFIGPDLVRSQAGAIGLAALAVLPSRLLIVSRGWQDGHPLTHEIQAVYDVLGARLTLRAWQERDL